MSNFLIKTKPLIKKPIFWIGILVCFLLIRYYLQKHDRRIDKDRINEHYSSMDLSIKPQNKYHEKYDLLIKEFQNFKNINLIAKSNGGILFGERCEIIGNYFTISKLQGKYTKAISNIDCIKFPFPISDTGEKFDLGEIEKKEGFKGENLKDIFRLMGKLDIEWISRNKNFIEFSSYVYPADESLDYYNGYIYCINDSLPQINKNVYFLLYHLEDNWYYFIRETYKGPVIYRSHPETDEDYQYLDNLNKTNN
jgi:hypothetical protein